MSDQKDQRPPVSPSVREAELLRLRLFDLADDLELLAARVRTAAVREQADQAANRKGPDDAGPG